MTPAERKAHMAKERANGRARERAYLKNAKPAGYTWRVEKLTPMQRAMAVK